MREIRFRAFAKGKMCHNLGDDSCGLNEYFSGVTIPIMQYTGLKDKRGQPIYEGDIIEAFGDDWEVEWEPTAGCFLCINLGQEGEYSEGMDFAREYELLIIGNIYENKYLLGETK